MSAEPPVEGAIVPVDTTNPTTSTSSVTKEGSNTINPLPVKSLVADARDLKKRVRMKMDVWITCGTDFEERFMRATDKWKWQLMMKHGESAHSHVELSFSEPVRVEENDGA